MKKRYTRRFAVMMWLSLIGLLPMMAQVTKPIEIKSMEQLQEVLSSPRLRSDAVTDLPITANGILVDKNVSVNAGSKYAIDPNRERGDIVSRERWSFQE